MKHERKWCTCDRCGKEIKVGLLATNSITRNGILNITYDLCNECMEEFEEFMRKDLRFITMSMAEVIKSIEREAFREAQSHEIGGRNGEPIDCSTLEDEPVIVADNEADRQALRDCFKERDYENN